MPGTYAHIAVANALPHALKRAGGPLEVYAAALDHLKYCKLGAISPDYPYLVVGDAHARRFLGYCSRSRQTANAIQLFLSEQLHLRVKSWETGFSAGSSILDEIETATRECTGGVFLFTKDDAIVEGDTERAAPRDNVVFEAGYFASARGRDRVLIIRQSGAKMPADLGGNIYLTLEDPTDTRPLESRIRDFVERRL